ncbi:hypothetical protein RFI_00287 [Reticulomyxa filosa]|uniref:WD-40 repeat protein n=1 Tax=Reticulomyxa filosa TaxID=46433 RepID=X6PE39_RETFI|nr:hypothetical protein RFI_00287 [Reticulomyxa filosa]|eukprot:ETO36775.1 hypothetical protein RFI_00287 [Reticulomyxa filosa]
MFVTICSVSFDEIIQIWDIETTKKLNAFKGHENIVKNKSIHLWDIQFYQQIQVFNGYTSIIWSVEYSPFVIKNSEIDGNSNVICSESLDRNKKNRRRITCFKFLQLKKKEKSNANLYYDSFKCTTVDCKKNCHT